jgi:ubiquinone/menaquinone biosynthesis C-methylase UbiE
MPSSGLPLASFIAFVYRSNIELAVAHQFCPRPGDTAASSSVVPLFPEDYDDDEEYVSLIQVGQIKDALGEKSQSERQPERVMRHMFDNFARMGKVLGKRGHQMFDAFSKAKTKADQKRKQQGENTRKQVHSWALQKVQDHKDRERKKYDFFVHHMDEYPQKFYQMDITKDWKSWYESMMQVYPPNDEGGYETLNYGLVTNPLEQCAAGVPANEGSRRMPFNHTSGANMYAFLASQSPVKLHHARVLEISHGRGGGAALLSDCYCPRLMVGVDLSRQQTDYATKRYGRDGECPIGFSEGDATSLPFGDNHFDVVLNVQASHAYPSYRTFIQEVKRVLKPGGAFLSSDFRYNFGAEAPGLIMQDEFQSPVKIMDVSSGVLQALNENRLVQPFVDECNADFGVANKKEDARLRKSYPRYFQELQRKTAEEVTGMHLANADLEAQVLPKRRKELGVPPPRSCANHAGLDHRDYLQSGQMLYLVHIITKNKADQTKNKADNLKKDLASERQTQEEDDYDDEDDEDEDEDDDEEDDEDGDDDDS